MTERGEKLLGWTLLALPGAWLALTLARTPEPWLADWIAASGLWSARFLILALALTPLQRLFGNRRAIRLLLRHRRAIGVAAFCYTAAHVALYVVDMADWGAILGEAVIPSMLAGWGAMLAMLFPFLASSDAAMRLLGKGWKRVQRLAYPATLLTLVHWLLVHDGAGEALLHFLPLGLLQLARLHLHLTTTKKAIAT
ncbi:ferric reductase-like transmembrane domain-containing protein [Sphingomicrobium astaxanthinifaciens]|uniref:ferric reductase-like transmembrane domain-containing protein n=1 Tax=Sphingomicrobium astaxanthinifaciens TaxID=1227949 RepID=UPI001FCB6186|nr:ferric reductase-like transmembrane domain-containing protein [Sphingomicrobium astaxanthinifaciens]MCJ7421612.1 ferric reductase-like transmembrane domain-containing protein [Sphingomicrobium astaxanthinifaciens]